MSTAPLCHFHMKTQPTSFPRHTAQSVTDSADMTHVYHLNSHKASTVYFNACTLKLNCTVHSELVPQKEHNVLPIREWCKGKYNCM